MVPAPAGGFRLVAALHGARAAAGPYRLAGDPARLRTLERGIGLAVLLAAAFLVRRAVPWARIALAYAVPVALACLMIGWFYSRSVAKSYDLAAQFEIKHTLNMGAPYAKAVRFQELRLAAD